VSAAEIVPDTKDWTWVLERPCAECGFRADDVARSDLGDRIRAEVPLWRSALADDAAARRPRPGVWSVLEYACHVRDVHRIFAGRVGLMLEAEEPTFDNWDQDRTAVEERYAEQDPAQVSAELAEAADAVAAVYDGVPDDAWTRRGRRSDGSGFTVESIGRYHLHDVLHHAWDVAQAPGRTSPDS
jgi:ADP-ribose pyrophosphatase YjhB (NUDIX family)